MTTSVCKNCLIPCATCNGSSIFNCQSCIDGYYLFVNYCIQVCPEGYYANPNSKRC